MIHDTSGRHHRNVRKRIHQKYEIYPHPDKFIHFIDILVIIAGFFAIAMTIPQILKIWIGKNAAGLSLISWSSYFLVSIVWLAYGIVHREKPIIIPYSVSLIFHIIIISGIIIYS